MNEKLINYWLIPIWIYAIYFCIRLIIAEFRLYFSFGLVAVGITLGAVALFLLSSLMNRHIVGQFITVILCFIGSIVIFMFVILTQFQSFLLPFIALVYMDGFAVYILISAVRQIRQKSVTKWSDILQKARKRILASIIAILLLMCASSLLILQLGSPLSNQSKTIMISDNQAERYNLVVYFPDINAVNAQIAEIMHEANATISFNMNENFFLEGNPDGTTYGQKIALLNSHNVKVEIWPIFNQSGDRGHYPTYSNAKYWMQVYQLFHEWVTQNDLTVDYLMWDIEVNQDAPHMNIQNVLENASEPWQTLGSVAGLYNSVRDVNFEWDTILSHIQEVGRQARADGYRMLCTTFCVVRDVFDGDDDLQRKYGLPAWAAGTDAFELISMMAYRGCEWGGNPSSRSMIYENVRAEAIAWKGDLAICLGCINYTPYPNITSVVEDVRLALGAGLNEGPRRNPEDISIRLFQANSWIDGVGTWQTSGGNWVYGGPAHGVDNESTEGLRQLLLECRKGGQSTFLPTPTERWDAFVEILADVAWDLAKPIL
jgi:hypothetical protein